MNEQRNFLNEQLSAILDGEAGELELRRFLQQLEGLESGQRTEILARWERYQRISAGLSGEAASARVSSDFAARISELIDAEPALSAAEVTVTDQAISDLPGDLPGSLTSENRPKVFGMRLAVAASVALAIVVGFQQLQISNQTEALRLAHNNLQGVAAEQSPVSGMAAADFGSGVDQSVVAGTVVAATNGGSIDSGIQPVDPAEAQRRLQEYLFEHANHASQQQAQGIVPFARVASFQAD